MDWCVSDNERAEKAKPEDVENVKSVLAENLRINLGCGDRSKGEEDRIGTIRQIKTVLAKN